MKGRILLIFWSLAFGIGSVTSHVSMAGTPVATSFLPFDANNSIIKMNRKGSMLAIVSGATELPSEDLAISIEIWKIDYSGRLQGRVFDQALPDGIRAFNWVNDTLLFSTFDENLLLGSTGNSNDVRRYLKNYSWSQERGRLTEDRIYANMCAVESEDGNMLAILDSDELRVKNFLRIKKMYTSADFPIQIYDVRGDWKLVKQALIHVMPPSFSSASFMPLILSPDGLNLLCRSSGTYPWRRDAYSDAEVLVQIDLSKNTYHCITSLERPDGLQLLGKDWASPCTPVSITGGRTICALKAYARNLRVRWVVFDSGGGELAGTNLVDRDLVARRAPMNVFPISWTHSGDGLMETPSGIWLLPANGDAAVEVFNGGYGVDNVQRDLRDHFLLRLKYKADGKTEHKYWCLIDGSVKGPFLSRGTLEGK